MKQLTIMEIKRRSASLRSTDNITSAVSIVEGAKMIKDSSVNEIKRFINNIRSKNNVPFYTYLELFDAIVEKGTKSDIEYVGQVLSEAAVEAPSIPDPAQAVKNMAKAIKARRTRAINKAMGHTSDAAKALDNLKSALSQNVPSGTVNTGTNSTSSEQPSSEETANQEAAIKVYDNILEVLDRCEHCDRIYENYERISKRFNLEILFCENTRINGVEDTIVELCNLVDTYNMPGYIKFNTIVESAWYGLSSYYIEFNKHTILETAIDYFRFVDPDMSNYKSVMDASLIYDKEDMKGIDVLTEEEPEDSNETVPYHTLTFAKIVKEEADFDEIFKKFKENELSDKPETKLNKLINKLYDKNPSDVINKTPSLLSWIRTFFIVSTGAIPVIGPIVAAIGLITDRCIANAKDRKSLKKMIESFNKEIEASKKKLESTKSTETKEKLQEYIDSLEKNKKKLVSREADLYSDEERFDNFDIDDDLGDADFNWDDDDLFEFDEMTNSIEKFYNMSPISENDIRMIPFSITSNTSITEISKIVNKFPDYFHKNAFVDALKESLTSDKTKFKSENSIDRSLKKNAIRDAIDLLESTPIAEEKFDNNTEIIVYYDALFEAVEGMNFIFSVINEFEGDISSIHEASISNSLKLASMKIKKALTKMNDKHKGFYKNIDIGVNNLKKAAEKSLTADNREAVIKGSVLPSASKVLKLAIMNAGLIAIGQPIIAVIATLGYLGASAGFKAKERQMVIDEIEIELKMCQKYIDIAESKNDMKALKELLMIQRNLERQHQRIKYNMNVKFGQKTYDTSVTNPNNK